MKGFCWGSFQEAMDIYELLNDPQRAYQSVSECKCYTIVHIQKEICIKYYAQKRWLQLQIHVKYPLMNDHFVLFDQSSHCWSWPKPSALKYAQLPCLEGCAVCVCGPPHFFL